MSNQAYLSVWCKDFCEAKMLDQFGGFLATVPFSKSLPGFTRLVVRAVDASESPVLEQDLRSVPLDANGVVELVQDYLHSDASYEVQTAVDLWVYQGSPLDWQQGPQPIEIFCHGEDFDDAFWKENGHLEVNLGFEHLFTGHAHMLGIRRDDTTVPQSSEEARFLASMENPANLQMYRERTQENIRKLFDWVRRMEKAMAVEKIRLWSEGEENFEATLEGILVAR
jgi:hypothetical protein